MNISIGISTLNDGLYRVKDNIKSIPSEQIVIIVHQITNDLSYKDVDLNRENVILVTLYEKGLSKSRNTLLMKAFELGVDYLIISDDDVSYSLKGLIKLKEEIKKYNNFPHFQMQSSTLDGSLRKKYPITRKKLNFIDAFSISSIEMCLNVKRIISKNIKFDEKFGLGALYPAGEEPIFVSDMLKAGECMLFVPITVTIHPIESSGLSIYNDRWALQSRGAVFVRCLGLLRGLVFSIIFWGKKFCLSNNTKTQRRISKLLALYLIVKGCMSV